MLAAALATAGTAGAQEASGPSDNEATITVDMSNDDWGNGGNYHYSWISTQSDPQLTLTVSNNRSNMNASEEGNINLYLGTMEDGYVYTLTASDGWNISSYSFTFTNSDTSVDMTVTPEAGRPSPARGTARPPSPSTASTPKRPASPSPTPTVPTRPPARRASP